MAAGKKGADVLSAREMVEEIVLALVDHVDEVRVREVIGTRGSIIEVDTAFDDVGKVIGHNGMHADAIRRLLGAIKGRTGRGYILDIKEEEFFTQEEKRVARKRKRNAERRLSDLTG